MKFVELQNTNGTRKFTIWGGLAIYTDNHGTEHRVELDAYDLFAGTVRDNVKALVGEFDITRVWTSTNDNGTSLYIELDGAKYERIELNGWEHGKTYPAL